MSKLILPDLKLKPVICTTQIIKIEADGNNCYIFKSDSNSGQSWSKVFVTNTLKHYEILLHDDGILRVNKSQMVNKEFIESISSDHVITMKIAGMGSVTIAEGFRHSFYLHFKM